MKQTLHLYVVFLLFFLLIVSSESIRAHSTKQGEEIKLKKITNDGIHPETVADNSPINELMGMEACEEGDNECIERRMASEAHLDYIYTQQHRPQMLQHKP